MTKDTNKVIEESLEAVKRMKQSAKNAAYEALKNDLLKEDILADLNEGKNDGVSTGGDQPSGFDKEGSGQKRIVGVGDSLESEGDGPAIIEGDEPDADAEMKLEDDTEDEKKDDMDEAEDEEKKDKESDDDEDDLDLDLNTVVAEMEDDEEKEKEEKKPAVKESEEEEKKVDDKVKKENVNLKKENAKLKLENSNLSKALKLTTQKANEATLVNQKMTYISDIFSKYPALKVENKRKIMNKFDNAKTLREAKDVYQIYVEALREFKSTNKSNKLTEARKIVNAANKNMSKNSELIQENYNEFAKMAGIE